MTALVHPANAQDIQRDLARLFAVGDKGKPQKHRAFRQLVLAQPGDKAFVHLEAVFDRLGKDMFIDANLVYHMASEEDPLFVSEIALAYRAHCRDDGGEDHAREVTDWHVYQGLCLLVGAGFGVWVPVDR